MKVNVVYTGKGKNNVLDRLAEALCKGNGWEYTRTPTGRADITHWICYIDYAEVFSDWHITPTSAWFTHYEENRTFKAFWWDVAQQDVDLRITVARQYLDGLAEYGATKLCPHPAIDPQFTWTGKIHPNDVPRVGVSGFVHPGGRKGEKLVARVAGKLGNRVAMVASGEGWPIECKMYEWEDLPNWYRSLDVHFCPSSVEGVPMPPLEALACGTPVVVPMGVGMLDDLPDVPGVYAYEQGNLDSALAAIDKALTTKHDRAELAEIVSDYSIEMWQHEHEQAFLQYLDSPKSVAVESDRHGNRGVVYVAFGVPSRRCAEASITSLKATNPQLQVGLVSTEPIGCEDVFIPCEDVDIGGRWAKTKLYELVPRDWQYVLYLDSDTEIRGEIDYLFNVLGDGWDMVICKNPAKYHVAYQMRRSDNKDECEFTFDRLGTGELVQLNGGVFGFSKNTRTKKFFERWHHEWQRWGKRDQGALLRALFDAPVKMWVLENYPWNTIVRYDNREGIVIAHFPMTARRWRGKVVERSDSQEAWQKVKIWERDNLK